MDEKRAGQPPSSFPAVPELRGRTVCLALQGGASLGAYTWGVLDALMEDGRLDVEGITGASAGAINAAAFGVGYATGGRPGARDLLRVFWEGLAHAAQARRRGPFDFVGALVSRAPAIRDRGAFYAITTRLLADFHMDPDTMEPLRSTLSRTLDFTALARSDAIKVFVNVTDVQTGEPEVFSGAEVDANVICASCALPFVFAPVEIRGRWFWDGGLLGNPAIYPVIYGCDARDVILVETIPARHEHLPRSTAEVMTRILQLSGGAGLMRELRMIQFVTRLLREAPRAGMREIQLHRIAAHPALATMDGRRGFRADVPYFHRLHGYGREAALQWLRMATLG